MVFAGSLRPGTEKEAQGVDGAMRGFKDVLPPLLSRLLRITEQHGKDFI